MAIIAELFPLLKNIFEITDTKYHFRESIWMVGTDTTMMSRKPRPRIIGLYGSLSDTSRIRMAVDEALAALNEAGARTDLVDLRQYDLPPLDAADTDGPAAEHLPEAVDGADSVLLGTPNYYESYSSALKTALDDCGRDEFEATTVGLLEVAAEAFPGAALIHLRAVSRTLGGWTLPTEIAIPLYHPIIDGTRITDPDLAERTQGLGERLTAYAGVATYPEINHGIGRVEAVPTAKGAS